MAWKGKGGAGRRRRTEVLERPEYGWIWKPLLTLLVLYLLVTLALGIWWSRTPAPHSVEQIPMERRGEAAFDPSARGTVTVATLASIVETLYAKPGGYLRNDLFPPGLWLDNMPHWELGVLRQAKDLARALPSMTPGEVEELEAAIRGLAGDGLDWYRPATEDHLAQTVAALDRELQRLGEDPAEGYTPGAGLPRWLADVTARLDDLALRLAAGVGSQRWLRELAIDTEALPPRTPWYRIDDVFFEARGTGWALVQMLEGVQRDQADVLEAAGVTEQWERLRAELAMTQRRLWSPVILSGSGFGPFANHSLVMALHVGRARDIVAELAESLATASDATPFGAGVDEAPAVEPEVEEVERAAGAAGAATPQAAPSPEAVDAEAVEDDAEPTAEEAGDARAEPTAEEADAERKEGAAEGDDAEAEEAAASGAARE